jgi:hypothetical protein
MENHSHTVKTMKKALPLGLASKFPRNIFDVAFSF